ncbi:MAG: acetyl-CoA C-acyltransferase, partial [Methylococcales bacterium]|nr:acetyl-CoA C-acyltransferase [Methylococcales bacterium]
MEKLGELRTVFKEDGTITAANSSGISDGACMAWIGNQSAVNQFGREPLVEIQNTVNIGLNPETMGLGPVYAINKLLNKTGLTLDEIDLFEINEAFAVQVLA